MDSRTVLEGGCILTIQSSIHHLTVPAQRPMVSWDSAAAYLQNTHAKARKYTQDRPPVYHSTH